MGSPGRSPARYPRRWIAGLGTALLLSASFAAFHGHPLESRQAGGLEIDAGCRVCLQISQQRAVEPTARLALPRTPLVRAEIHARPGVPAIRLLAFGPSSRAPPLVRSRTEATQRST